MEVHYCWVCKTDVTMFDADEAATVLPLYHDGLRALKARRMEKARRGEIPRFADDAEQTADLRRDELACWKPMLDEIERLTGVRPDDPGAVQHHQLALFGPACSACGRLLRTSKAEHCAACGHDR